MVRDPNPTTFRPNVDDMRLIADLKKKTGITRTSEILRMGLRALAGNLKAPKNKAQ